MIGPIPVRMLASELKVGYSIWAAKQYRPITELEELSGLHLLVRVEGIPWPLAMDKGSQVWVVDLDMVVPSATNNGGAVTLIHIKDEIAKLQAALSVLAEGAAPAEKTGDDQ